MFDMISSSSTFMPRQFAAGKYVFLFLSIGRLFDMSTSLNGAITITSKKYKYDLYFTCFLIGLTVYLNYLFIRVYGMGMNGAAIATMISVICSNILRLISVRYFFGMQPFEFRNLWVVGLGGLIFFLNGFLPLIGNVYTDMLVRSVLITAAFMGPVVLFRLSPEMNGFAVKYLKAIGIRIRFLE